MKEVDKISETPNKTSGNKLKIFIIISIGIFAGMLISLYTAHMVEETSDEEFCGSCHSMQPMVKAYREDIHGGNNRVGFKAKCTDCHLPHDGILNYMTQKTLTGINDIWVETFEDTDKIDWQAKRLHRRKFVYDSGCLKCHKNLKKATESNPKAFIAHKSYFMKKKELNLSCVSCHENIGHKNLSSHLKNK